MFGKMSTYDMIGPFGVTFGGKQRLFCIAWDNINFILRCHHLMLRPDV